MRLLLLGLAAVTFFGCVPLYMREDVGSVGEFCWVASGHVFLQSGGWTLIFDVGCRMLDRGWRGGWGGDLDVSIY